MRIIEGNNCRLELLHHFYLHRYNYIVTIANFNLVSDNIEQQPSTSASALLRDIPQNLFSHASDENLSSLADISSSRISSTVERWESDAAVRLSANDGSADNDDASSDVPQNVYNLSEYVSPPVDHDDEQNDDVSHSDFDGQNVGRVISSFRRRRGFLRRFISSSAMSHRIRRPLFDRLLRNVLSTSSMPEESSEDEDRLQSWRRLSDPFHPHGLQGENNLSELPGNDQEETSRASTSKSAECDDANDSSAVGAGDCSICISNKANTVVYDCGHVCMCVTCAKALKKRERSAKCPICRNPIKDIIKLYTV